MLVLDELFRMQDGRGSDARRLKRIGGSVLLLPDRPVANRCIDLVMPRPARFKRTQGSVVLQVIPADR